MEQERLGNLGKFYVRKYDKSQCIKSSSQVCFPESEATNLKPSAIPVLLSSTHLQIEYHG